VVHLVNGLLDARKEGAPVIAIAGDVETSVLDSDTVEELNPRPASGPRGTLPMAGSAGCSARSRGRQQEAGFIPFGTDFANPDFSRVAEALGARGIRIEEPGDVRDGLQAALSHKGGPVVVDVLVDRYALARPVHVPAKTAAGFTLISRGPSSRPPGSVP